MVCGVLEIRHASHSVGFYVCLVNDIKSVTVTYVKPARVIGIMTATYGIDVKRLHHLDIVHHNVNRRHMSKRIVCLMTECEDNNRPAINSNSFIFDRLNYLLNIYF